MNAARTITITTTIEATWLIADLGTNFFSTSDWVIHDEDPAKQVIVVYELTEADSECWIVVVFVQTIEGENTGAPWAVRSVAFV